MDILEIAIDSEGGVGKLAAALGERQNTVSMWRKRGLSRSWLQVLTLRYAANAEAPDGGKTPVIQSPDATETVAESGAVADTPKPFVIGAGLQGSVVRIWEKPSAKFSPPESGT